MISENHHWSGQKGMIMTRSPPHLTSLPMTSWMMFGGRKACLRSFGYLSFKASPPNALLFERPRMKYWGTLCACLLANWSTTRVPHHLNNLLLAGSPKLPSWVFLHLDRAYTQKFPTPLRYSGHTVTPFSWHMIKIFLSRSFRIL